MSDDPNKFGVGDTMRVSNVPGPRMVVTSIERAATGEAAKLRCMWFDRRYELRSWAFETRLLSKASPWQDKPRRIDDPDSFDALGFHISDNMLGIENAAD